MIEDALFCMKEIADIEVCENCKNHNRCDHTLIEENARYAIEALEKQIPKKPYKVMIANEPIEYCGACDMVCGDGVYCRMCGTKIDRG